MAKCQSWRPLVGATSRAPNGPGGKARKWVPCTNEVEDGQVRCLECTRALTTNPDPVVRSWLIDEVPVNVPVLQTLAADGDPTVARKAQAKLEATRNGVTA